MSAVWVLRERVDTPFGPVEVAAGEAGLRHVVLRAPAAAGGAADADRRAAGSRPAAARHLAAAVDAVLAYAEGDASALAALALDEAGLTRFRREVYRALRAVPTGETLTYGELAAEAGYPGAARAVGGAMASNPWPLVVPCHRVLAAGGGLGGFGPGLALKRTLLQLEGAMRPGVEIRREH